MISIHSNWHFVPKSYLFSHGFLRAQTDAGKKANKATMICLTTIGFKNKKPHCFQ